MTKYFGMKHHSPSALNFAAASFPGYFLEKVLGQKSPASAAMHRGTAAELGVVHGLENPTCAIKECISAAIEKYDSLTALCGDHQVSKQRDAIPGIVEQGILALRPYGIPDMKQKRIFYKLDGVDLPLLGFLDVGWSEHNIVVDLKTSLRLESEITEPHSRQLAAYVHGTNAEGRICYATPKKYAVYRLEDPSTSMNSLINIARRVEKFLSISTDPMEIASFLIPDYTHYAFNNEKLRAKGKEVFGF